MQREQTDLKKKSQRRTYRNFFPPQLINSCQSRKNRKQPFFTPTKSHGEKINIDDRRSHFSFTWLGKNNKIKGFGSFWFVVWKSIDCWFGGLVFSILAGNGGRRKGLFPQRFRFFVQFGYPCSAGDGRRRRSPAMVHSLQVVLFLFFFNVIF